MAANKPIVKLSDSAARWTLRISEALGSALESALACKTAGWAGGTTQTHVWLGRCAELLLPKHCMEQRVELANHFRRERLTRHLYHFVPKFRLNELVKDGHGARAS